MKFATFAYLGW